MTSISHPAIGPWESCGYRDPEAARLFRAVFSQRRRLAKDFRWIPVQERRLMTGDEKLRPGFPVGALVHLWGRWPGFHGQCPECSGLALGFAASGLIAEAYVFGVCRRCALMVHRPFWGIGEIFRRIAPLFAKTEFHASGPRAMSDSSGLPHTSLITVLRYLGETDLPDPHAWGFVGGRPLKRCSVAGFPVENDEPVPADAVPPNVAPTCVGDDAAFAAWRRAKVWGGNVAVTHALSRAFVETNDAVRRRVRRFAFRFLLENGRLPEGPHLAEDALLFEFPFIRVTDVPEHLAGSGSASPSATAPSLPAQLSTRGSWSHQQYVVKQVASDNIFEDTVWEVQCWSLADAHRQFDDRVAANRVQHGAPLYVLLFDCMERRLVRSSVPVRDPEAEVRRWLEVADAPGVTPNTHEDSDRRPAETSADCARASASDAVDDFVEPDADVLLPAELQRVADALLAASREGRRNAGAFERLTAWLEEHANDVVFSHDQSSLPALSPERIRSAFATLDDEEVLSNLEMDERTQVTSLHRIAYFEKFVLETLFADADIASSFSPVHLKATDGTVMVLVNDVRGYSFTGLTVEWWGPYESFEAFGRSLVAAGWITDLDDFRALPHDEKLNRLGRPPGRP